MVALTRSVLASAALIGLAGIAACGSTAATAPATSPSPTTVTETKTIARHVTSERSAHPIRQHTRTTTSPAPKRKPTHHRSRSLNWTMPNEVGRDLQSAQDDVQRVSGDPVFFSHSHDLLGDRFQILDRDWQVCSQNVSPGTTVGPTAHIDFGVVKAYETCP